MHFVVQILHLIPDLFAFDAFPVALARVFRFQVRDVFERRFRNERPWPVLR